jgi:putative transposase
MPSRFGPQNLRGRVAPPTKSLPGASRLSRCRGSTSTVAISLITRKTARILFITYSTWHRWKLLEIAKDLALDSCRRADGRKYSLYAAVVMPDHVHLICLPLMDENGSNSIPEITRTVKSESAHRINNALTPTGRVWQDESFDHILRGDESLRKKAMYILKNPVRAGSAASPGEYRWWWWDAKLIESVA